MSEDLKTNCKWLKLLVAELSVLHGLFNKRTIYGTRHFIKARVSEKRVNKNPDFEVFEMLLFNSMFVGYVLLSNSF